jgi:hypothetical protein
MKTMLALLILLGTCLLFAEEVEHNLGFAAGAVSGIGVSYRQMHEKIGFQLTGAGYAQGENDSDEYNREWNTGFQGFYTLSKPGEVRFYVIGGASFFYNEFRSMEDIYTYDGTYVGKKKEYELSRSFNIGTGIGMQVTFLKHANIAIEWPLFYNTEGFFMMYIPQIGIYYKF